MKRMFCGFFVFTLIFLVSCSSFTLTGTKYPPLPENAQIDVIMRAVPNYKVEQIGVLENRCGLEKQCIENAKKVARENGGDVVILTTVTTVADQSGIYKIMAWEISKKR
jgi:hypothetical protein